MLKDSSTQTTTKMINFSNFDSLLSMTNYFDNDAICKQTIIESRWMSDGELDVVCPVCGEHHCVTRKDGRFRCNHCKHNFSCTVGTIFENTKVSLQKWFIAMYLVSSHKKGISSCQLSRDINVTQNTAWYMLQKIRTLYAQNDEKAMTGTVECDEVYIGGKEKWKHQSMKTPNTQGRSTKTKTPVFGMMERSSFVNYKGEVEKMSYVHAFVVEKTNGANLLPIIGQFVEKDSSVYTDELNAYGKLNEMGYNHHYVNHGSMQFVDENNSDIYTNGIEGFWSHFRRMITGCYHDCSDKHLQKYVDEACYRWNTRKKNESERFADMFTKSIGLVKTWSEIKGKMVA